MFKRTLSFLFFVFITYGVIAETLHGIDCNEERKGKMYVFTGTNLPGRIVSNPAKPYMCDPNGSGSWILSQGIMLPFCFDENEQNPLTAPKDFKEAGMTPEFRTYVNKNATPVSGTTYAYEYVNDKNTMCIWCLPKQYGYVIDQRQMACYDKEKQANCMYAKDKKGQNVEWEDNKCKCNDSDKTWNEKQNTCVIKQNKIQNVSCDDDNNGERYVFSSINDNLLLCKDNSWIKEPVPRCFTEQDWTSVSMTPSGYDRISDGTLFDIYVKPYGAQRVTNADGTVYKFVNNKDIMCLACAPNKFTVFVNNKFHCADEEQAAWCLFAYSKKGEKVDWDTNNNTCKCTESGKTWNKENHTCISDNPEDQENNTQTTCSTPWGDLEVNKMLQETVTTEDCKDIEKTENNVNLVKKWNVACKVGPKLVCQPNECVDKYKVVNEKCVEEESENQPESKEQTCEQLYPDNPTARACCETGKDKALWDTIKNICRCVIHSKIIADTIYNPKATGDKCTCEDTNKTLQGDKCVEEKQTTTITTEQLNAAKKKVDEFFTNADKNASSWKDAEGNINKLRLASDISAGVVLGTVGGVVSGVVIKKKQIEKGFDVLHCAVGGQKMANWGDTFTIGLKQ